jgi:MFS family permease
MSTLTVAQDHDLHRFRHRWTAAFVVGEMVGFLPPAICGATLAAVGVPDIVLVVGLTLAGLLEGLAIGVAQARVLARFAPDVDGHDWVVATVAAAGFAWFVGMGGGALMGAAIGPPILVAALLIPAWCAALLSMGYAQWRVLRRTVLRSSRWVWVTAGAWLLGVMIPTVALSTAPNSWPGVVHAGIGVLAAMAMGLTVGGLTGHTLERLLDTSP